MHDFLIRVHSWAIGAVTATGSAVFTFLADNYRAIGSVGVIIGVAIAIHGAYWLHKTKRLQAQRHQIEINRLLSDTAKPGSRTTD